MKITFKNVGQGDSILLEWQKKDAPFTHLGIIDCKKHDSGNPVLEHIIESGTREIEFIILSHPHFDHYSGMLDVLNHCESKNIRIHFFGFSLGDSQLYFKLFNKSEEAAKLLTSILKKVQALKKTGRIDRLRRIAERWDYPLNEDFSIRCLAPAGEEEFLFVEKVKIFNEKSNEYSSSQAANLLSTIFLIESKSKDSGVILTSDSCFETFERIREKNMGDFKKFKLLLCQIPHHGAIENHQMEFWSKLDYEINCPAIVSAGQHKRYSHPSKEVVRDFHDHSFKIHSTNFVNGMQDFFSEKADNVSLKLGMASEVFENLEMEGDQVFQLTTDTVIYFPRRN